jgi:hypothetical protein
MISRGQMYRQMYNIGGEGIMSLDAGAPSIKYEGDIKPRQEVADVNLPLDVQGWFQSLSFEQQLQLLSSDIDEAYKVELRKLLGKNTDSGIMNSMPRDMAAFGGLKKVFKKATNVVKDVVKSDIGKTALGLAGLYYAPALFGGTAGFGPQSTYRNFFGGIAPFAVPGVNTEASSYVLGNTIRSGASKMIPSALKSKTGVGIAALGGLTGFLAGQGKSTEEIESIISRPESLKPYLKQYYLNLNPDLKDTMEGEAAAESFAQSQMGEYGYENKAQGGRIGYNSGTFPLNKEPEPETDLMKAAKQKAQAEGISIQEALKQLMERNFHAYGGRTMKALGDTASMASGIEGLPLRQNPMGTNEIDLRDSGGFIPPVGIKEKADDIPAMLSNNEFVFTADAVRGMGNGDVNVGAQRMYDMMKRLENGGRV